ncbi:hypothetical protein GCM10009108_09040 [Castellaniella ginsengisoli]|uniref:Uncharacterized protein n=1 Tax=Castellaniella ginsengisoli TaxID=546114 RepID=A0ABN1KTQ9_9BURK
MHETIQKRARRQDYRSGPKFKTNLSPRPDDPISFQNQIIYGLLKNHQIFLSLQNHPHGAPV